GLKLNKQSFEDHKTYTPEMFNDMQDKPILMTEKDAVKLESIGVKGWFLEVNAKIEETFYSMLIERLQQHAKQKLTGDT
ncbi:MAG: tetraacyldisaccharide 4'-kinase, partial [Pontibacterium sp.]